MRLDRFDLNLLVVLDALLEERNVTKASERLHIGQSAASGALARLREYFGDELLVAVGRRFTLTPLAQSLVEPVRDTLLRARAAISLKPGFDPATAERRFTVCASDYVTTVMLAAAVRRMAQQAPGIALDIRSPPKDVAEVLERGDVDLLVLPEQYVSRLPHPKALLFEDTQVCMVWAGHSAIRSTIVGAIVGASDQTLDFDGYMQLGHVAVRFGNERDVSTFEDWFLPRYGVQRRIESTVDNFSTVPLLIIGTDRVATLASRLASHFAEHLPVRVIAAPFDMPTLSELMVWPRHLDHDPAHVWMRETLLACASELPAAGQAGSAPSNAACSASSAASSADVAAMPKT